MYYTNNVRDRESEEGLELGKAQGIPIRQLHSVSTPK